MTYFKCKQKQVVLLHLFLFQASILFTPVSEAQAWGPKAHQIVGHVAEHFLQPEVKTILRQEFNIKHLAHVAVWADDIRKSRKQKPWHYTNIKKGELTYLKERDCSRGNCVVERIDFYHQKLRKRDLSKKQRRLI